MAEDLKPCPFCGGTPRQAGDVKTDVTCDECGVFVDRDVWNRRHTPNPWIRFESEDDATPFPCIVYIAKDESIEYWAPADVLPEPEDGDD